MNINTVSSIDQQDQGRETAYTPNLSTDDIDFLSDEKFSNDRECAFCFRVFQVNLTRKIHNYCADQCRLAAADERKLDRQATASKVRRAIFNARFATLHRDCAMSFDGRYEGPLNCYSTDNRWRRGTPSIPVGYDKPAPVIEQKFVPLDLEYMSKMQAAERRGDGGLPRALRNYCGTCKDRVINPAGKVVREWLAMYLPVNHPCGKLRVFDIYGKLLEVKSL